MTKDEPTLSSVTAATRKLTAAEFHQLATVPAEAEWFANLENPRTKRAYRTDLQDFMSFAGIARPEEFRIVTRAHVLAWRATMEERGAAPRRAVFAEGPRHPFTARGPQLRIHGKGNKLRHLPLHPGSAERIHTYLEAARHGNTPAAALFQPARRKTGAGLTADGVYKTVLACGAGPD